MILTISFVAADIRIDFDSVLVSLPTPPPPVNGVLNF
jgi:hypothetical protein